MNTLPKSFAEYLTEHGHTPNTVHGYTVDINHYARWIKERYKDPLTFETMQAEHLQAYIQELINRQYKPTSIRRKIAALKAYGHYGFKTGQLRLNPAIELVYTERAQLQPEYLTTIQTDVLRQAIRNALTRAHEDIHPTRWLVELRDALVVLILLETGLRVQELCKLQQTDLVFVDPQIQITVKGGVSQYAARVIPVHSELLYRELSLWLRHHPRKSCPALFVNLRGKPLDIRSAQRAVYMMGKQIDTPITCQALRHTYARQLFAQGTNEEIAARLLGLAVVDARSYDRNTTNP